MSKTCRNCEKTFKDLDEWFYSQVSKYNGRTYYSTMCKKCEHQYSAMKRREQRARKKLGVVANTDRTCRDCGLTCPASEADEHFYRSGKYWQSYCRKCSNLRRNGKPKREVTNPEDGRVKGENYRKYGTALKEQQRKEKLARIRARFKSWCEKGGSFV